MKQEQDTAILVVSFGTSYNDNRKVTIDAIEETVAEAFPAYEVRRAFTSQMIINKLRKRDGLIIDNEAESLGRAAADGVRKLVVQPTHLMDGTEYHDLLSDVEKHGDLFESVSVGRPLLSSARDFEKVAEAMTEDTRDLAGEKTAVVLMGHGTGAKANRVYLDLQNKLREKGFHHYYIATVEAEPALEDILPSLKAGGYEKVVLQPLMIVAGDHANNDMASDEEDSWKRILEKEGYQVQCVLRGMGQIPTIREIFAEHTKEAFERL